MAYIIKKINIKNTDYIVRDDEALAIIEPIDNKIYNINGLITLIYDLINNISGRLSTAETRIIQL